MVHKNLFVIFLGQEVGEIAGITTEKCLCVGKYVIFMGKQGTTNFALSQIAVFGIPIKGFDIF